MRPQTALERVARRVREGGHDIPADVVVRRYWAGQYAPPDNDFEFYVRRLAKAGVRLVSITQELGDDPVSNMIRQIVALFDE
jgi:site-specific DNA recombinase